MLLGGIGHLRGIEDTICFRRIRIDEFYGICCGYRAIPGCTFREGIVEQRHRAFAVAAVFGLRIEIDMRGLPVISKRDIALRNHNIRNIVRDMEPGQFCRIFTVGNGIGNRISRLSVSLVHGFCHRDRLTRLIDFDSCVTTWHVLISVHLPGCSICLRCFVFRHCFQLLFRNLCIVGHLIAALGNTCRTKCRSNIEGETLSTLRNSHSGSVDFHTGCIQRLQTAQRIVEGHGIQIRIHIDIG